MEKDTHDMKSELKKYKAVYICLLVLTAITVGVSYVHLSVKLGIMVALIVATFKASLVASFFMHLAHEKKAIYILLLFTLFFFVSMILLIYFAQINTYEGLEYVS